MGLVLEDGVGVGLAQGIPGWQSFAKKLEKMTREANGMEGNEGTFGFVLLCLRMEWEGLFIG